jgi:hypothetical protein
MSTRALLIAAGLLAASFTPALAESITANVANWDPANRTIVFEDRSALTVPATTTVPADLGRGDQVTIDFDATEDGVQAVNSLTVIKDIAKRLLPPTRG